MKEAYQIIAESDSGALAEFLSKDGQLLLPMLELIQQAKMAVDEAIDVSGRATLEALLLLAVDRRPEKSIRGRSRGRFAGTVNSRGWCAWRSGSCG